MSSTPRSTRNSQGVVLGPDELNQVLASRRNNSNSSAPTSASGPPSQGSDPSVPQGTIQNRIVSSESDPGTGSGLDCVSPPSVSLNVDSLTPLTTSGSGSGRLPPSEGPPTQGGIVLDLSQLNPVPPSSANSTQQSWAVLSDLSSSMYTSPGSSRDPPEQLRDLLTPWSHWSDSIASFCSALRVFITKVPFMGVCPDSVPDSELDSEFVPGVVCSVPLSNEMVCGSPMYFGMLPMFQVISWLKFDGGDTLVDGVMMAGVGGVRMGCDSVLFIPRGCLRALPTLMEDRTSRSSSSSSSPSFDPKIPQVVPSWGPHLIEEDLGVDSVGRRRKKRRSGEVELLDDQGLINFIFI